MFRMEETVRYDAISEKELVREGQIGNEYKSYEI